jgi:hypothetical protein
VAAGSGPRDQGAGQAARGLPSSGRTRKVIIELVLGLPGTRVTTEVRVDDLVRHGPFKTRTNVRMGGLVEAGTRPRAFLGSLDLSADLA